MGFTFKSAEVKLAVFRWVTENRSLVVRFAMFLTEMNVARSDFLQNM